MVRTVHVFSLFNFGTTLSLLSSFNRELISKGIRRTSIGRESFILFNMSWDPYFYYWVPLVLTGRFARKFGHHTALQNTAQGGKKKHFRLTCVRRKTSFKLPIKMLNNINIQNVVSPLLLFSLDLSNLRQGQGAWICIILFTRVFIPPRVFFTFLKVLKSTK